MIFVLYFIDVPPKWMMVTWSPPISNRENHRTGYAFLLQDWRRRILRGVQPSGTVRTRLPKRPIGRANSSGTRRGYGSVRHSRQRHLHVRLLDDRWVLPGGGVFTIITVYNACDIREHWFETWRISLLGCQHVRDIWIELLTTTSSSIYIYIYLYIFHTFQVTKLPHYPVWIMIKITHWFP